MSGNEANVARGIIQLAVDTSKHGSIGEQHITVPLDGANPRDVAQRLYGFQRVIDKISTSKRGNEITVVFG